MANVFKPKRSSTASSVPTTSNLADGELAVNSADKKIYLRDGTNIIEVANASSGGSSGITTFQDKVHLLDDIKLHIGGAAGDDGDLQIYHDGTKSVIADSGTGNLVVSTSTLVIKNAADSEAMLKATQNAAVELYYDNSKKFETTGVGVTVTGDLIVSNNARVSGVLTVGQASVTIDGTDNTIHGFDALIAPPKRDSIVTITVTVATKTSAHRYYDTGSTSGYFLNGVESPFLTLIPGRTYKFDQSDSSNAGHPLRLYRDVDKNTQYSTNVTTVGTPGSAGAYTQIITGDTTPTVLHYQCSAHVKMGNSLQTNSEGSSTDASSGTYGDARYSPQITVDASGRITGITEVEIFSSGLGGDLDLNNNDITGTGNINITGAITASGNITANGNIVGDSSTNISGISSVTATSFHGSASDMTGLTAVGGGTYGSSSAVPVITVDSNGRITSISPVTVSGGGGGGAGSAGVTRNITTFTATAGQTSFNVSYTVGTIDVFLNGSRLTDAEFTATNGTSVVLATGASLNDVIDVAAYSSSLGIEVKNNGTLVGTATTIDFSTDLTATFSNGTATVVSTASGGGGGGVSEALAIAYAVAL